MPNKLANPRVNRLSIYHLGNIVDRIYKAVFPSSTKSNPDDPDRIIIEDTAGDRHYSTIQEIRAGLGTVTWADVDKTVSDIADITTKSHTSLTDVGSNTHAQVDTHLGLSDEHLDWTANQGATNIHYDNNTEFGVVNQGVVPGSGGGTSNYLRADGTWSTPPGGAGGGTPMYIYIKATGQSEGDLHLSDVTNWNVDLALIKEIMVETSSTDWDLYLLQNDNGFVTDDANIPARPLNIGGNGDETIYVDLPYEDEDGTKEVHLYWVDNIGSTTVDIYITAYELSV
jgi:hypothetical protein